MFNIKIAFVDGNPGRVTATLDEDAEQPLVAQTFVRRGEDSFEAARRAIDEAMHARRARVAAVEYARGAQDTADPLRLSKS